MTELPISAEEIAELNQAAAEGPKLAQGLPWPTHSAAELFPLLTGSELDELADDVRVNGLIEPVWLHDDQDLGTVLLDGRNRARACQIAGVEIRTRKYTGDDPIGFSISQNMKRRHLTTGQKASVAARAEPMIAEEIAKKKAANQSAVGKQYGRGRPKNDVSIVATWPQYYEELPAEDIPPGPSEEDGPDPKARDVAASVSGTSGRSVGRYKRVAQQAPDLATKVDSGELELGRAERIIRDREAEKRRIEQARKEAAEAETRTMVDIRCGDFRETLADLENVDAIITDPPYPHEFIPLLEDLAAWADKVLSPEGVLAVLIGQTYLPEVYRLLDGHRPYRWTGCYLTAGSGYVSHPRKVQSNWKPLIVYGGTKRFTDVVRSEGTDAYAKSNHKWGQDYAAFHTIIERLTQRGQTVVDPFMGSGTTLLAAHALGRHAIGCDVDEESVEKSRERLDG